MVFKQNFSLSKPTASWKRVTEQLKKRQGWKEKELWKKHISRKRLNLKTIAQPATYLKNFDSCVRQQKKTGKLSKEKSCVLWIRETYSIFYFKIVRLFFIA